MTLNQFQIIIIDKIIGISLNIISPKIHNFHKWASKMHNTVVILVKKAKNLLIQTKFSLLNHQTMNMSLPNLHQPGRK